MTTAALVAKGRRVIRPTSAADELIRRRLQIGAVTLIALTVIVATPNFFKTYGVLVGKPSPRTIKAPHGVSFVDTARTQVLRKAAAGRVEGAYEVDPNALVRVERNVDGFFAKAAAASARGGSLAAKIRRLDNGLDVKMPRRAVRQAVMLDRESLALMRDRARRFVATFLADKITTENIESKRQSMRLAAAAMDLPRALGELVGSVAGVYLEPTYMLDASETGRLRQAAALAIAPVVVRKQRGETLVEEGKVVTPSDIEALEQEGLLGGAVGAKQVLGYALAVLMVVLTVSLYLEHYRRDIFDDTTRLTILALIVVGFALIVKVMSPFSSPFLLPFAAPAILAATLLGGRTSVITTLVVAVLSFLMVPEAALPVVILTIGSLAGALMLAKIVERRHVFVGAAVAIGIIGYLGVTSSFIAGLTFRESLLNGGLGLIGGLAGVVLGLGSLPLFESVFHVTTDLRLLELADPSQPLMQELMLNAPGTYNHSMVVGNLAESAAPFVGANPLKARVGAYYHDIGKLRRPLFFVENQLPGQNPHDHTKPHLSCLIVTSHVKDGVELAEENNVPAEIVDIIGQHHGTSLVTYFYEEAKRRETKQQVNEEDFRYGSEKPRTPEAALVMLADIVEAAARTMRRPTPTRLEHLAKKLIKARLDDGQLDESGLTLGDLDQIGNHFAQALASIYHARVDYPQSTATPIAKARKTRDGQGK